MNGLIIVGVCLMNLLMKVLFLSIVTRLDGSQQGWQVLI